MANYLYEYTRKQFVVTFLILSIFMIFLTLSGLLIFKSNFYQLSTYVWFLITGTLTICCLIPFIYNLILMIKEKNNYIEIL